MEPGINEKRRGERDTDVRELEGRLGRAGWGGGRRSSAMEDDFLNRGFVGRNLALWLASMVMSGAIHSNVIPVHVSTQISTLNESTIPLFPSMSLRHKAAERRG